MNLPTYTYIYAYNGNAQIPPVCVRYCMLLLCLFLNEKKTVQNPLCDFKEHLYPGSWAEYHTVLGIGFENGVFNNPVVLDGLL